MRSVLRLDQKPISPAKALKLSKFANISTPIMRREAIMSDTMQSALSYVQAFEEGYGVRFVYMLIMHVVEHLISANFLGDNSRATYLTLH